MTDLEYKPIATTRTVYNVRQFISWYRQKQLHLRPAFQRGNVWKPIARSYLIDSILRGMPLPIVILRQQPGLSLEPRLEVVDGQQRLTTLIAFADPELFPESLRFTLSKAHTSDYANYAFGQLPQELRDRILDYEISTHVLPSAIENRDVLRIFQRLNMTGTRLNAQELRNSQYQGVFRQLVSELSISNYRLWNEGKIFSNDKLARMEEAQFTAQLVISVLRGSAGMTKATIDGYYKRYEEEFPEAEVVKDRVSHILERLGSMASTISGSEFRKSTWLLPLFESLHDKIYGGERQAHSPIVQRVRAKSWPPHLESRLAAFSLHLLVITSSDAQLAKRLAARTTNPKERQTRRKIIDNYLNDDN